MSSIGLLTWDSISSGPTPGSMVVMEMIGKVISGIISTPSRV